MQCKLSFSVTRPRWAPCPHARGRLRPGYSGRDLSRLSSRFKLVGQSSNDKWKLNDIDASECLSISSRSGGLLLASWLNISVLVFALLGARILFHLCLALIFMTERRSLYWNLFGTY